MPCSTSLRQPKNASGNCKTNFFPNYIGESGQHDVPRCWECGVRLFLGGWWSRNGYELSGRECLYVVRRTLSSYKPLTPCNFTSRNFALRDGRGEPFHNDALKCPRCVTCSRGNLLTLRSHFFYLYLPLAHISVYQLQRCSTGMRLVVACDPTGPPGPWLPIRGEHSASGLWEPGGPQGQALCLNPAGRHLSCSRSMLMLETWGLLASLP